MTTTDVNSPNSVWQKLQGVNTAGQGVNETPVNWGDTYTKPLNDCFVDDQCNSVVFLWGRYNVSYSLHNPTSTNSDAYVDTYKLKQPKDQICNTPGLVEPYLSTCLTRCASKPGTCDAMMVPYCLSTAGKTNPKCACINSKVANAPCNDTACMNTGYMTTNMMNLTSGGCPVAPPPAPTPVYTPPPPTFTSAPAPTSITAPSTTTSTTAPKAIVPLITPPAPAAANNTMMYVIIGLLGALLLAAGYYIFVRKPPMAYTPMRRF
jgi:hypothetical protein